MVSVAMLASIRQVPDVLAVIVAVADESDSEQPDALPPEAIA